MTKMEYIKWNRVNINYSLFLIVIFALILFSNSFFNGFLEGHEGFAGPHLLSVSINELYEPEAFLYDEVIKGENGEKKFSLYNHHPSLPFIIDKYFLKVIETNYLYLKASYFKAVFLNLLGIYLIFLQIARNSSRRSALFGAIAILSTINIFKFLNLTTFDSYSVLSCYIFFTIFNKWYSAWTFKEWIKTILLLLLLLSISWYNQLIFYAFFGLIILQWVIDRRVYGLTYQKLSALLVVTIYSMIMVFNRVFYKTTVELIGNKGPKGFIPFRIPDYPIEVLIKQIILFGLKSIPLLFMLAITKTIFKSKKVAEKLPLPYFSPLIFIGLFFLIDIKWNLIHNFTALYLSPYLVLLFFKLYPKTRIASLFIYLQFALFLVVSYTEFRKDLTSSISTEIEIESILKEKEILLLENLEFSQKWNRGQFLYLKALTSFQEKEP